ncbi:hypothetical protein E4L95_02000 [Paracoccus liaowanqingii]|uniref:Uncharacterized protein n=1 Tax=Paracoccus liaowanqingii TaxID=2560053 RepID=A0A4Z1CSQ2_9RHOB|nr:hypothetical protein [Paracoccus liaowanqingii]TGN68284.1 hypothetical protein E4L95_02000 [Paracoccus liaowanqingii]
MPITNNINITDAATLTEAELFQRYLDTPVRVGATNSMLVEDPGTMHRTTAREKFAYDTSFPLLEPMMEELPESLLSFIEENPDPIFLMDTYLVALESLVSALKTVKHDFTRVAELTITPKADGAGETAYRGWDHDQRFVLPVDDSEKAA